MYLSWYYGLLESVRQKNQIISFGAESVKMTQYDHWALARLGCFRR
jgi:hypothetical protein